MQLEVLMIIADKSGLTNVFSCVELEDLAQLLKNRQHGTPFAHKIRKLVVVDTKLLIVSFLFILQ